MNDVLMQKLKMNKKKPLLNRVGLNRIKEMEKSKFKAN